MKQLTPLTMIILFIAGCGSLLLHPSIFENPICKPPCWEGISPGNTSKTDALIIMSKIKPIDKPVIDHNQTFAEFDDAINFSVYKKTLGFMYTLNGQVSIVGFEDNLDITLQRAIESFGIPQSALIIHSGEIYRIILLNSSKGIAYGYGFSNGALEIKPGDQIDDVIFFDPKQYQLIINSGIFSYHQMSADETMNNMLPWKGYGKIIQYENTITP